MHLYTKAKTYLPNLQYFLISAIVLIIPYWGLFKWAKPLILTLFFSTLLLGQINFKEILKNRVIVSLFLFIIFTYISGLWTPSDTIFSLEWRLNFNSSKYYFLLIPAIYSAALSTKEIKNIFLTMALSPLLMMFIYFANALGITNIYSFMIGGDSHFINHYLLNNFFILFGAIYFYILVFENFIKQEYKKSIFFLFLTLIYFISMFIDPKNTARLIILIFFVIVLIVPLFYLSKKQAIVIFLLSTLLITGYVITSPRVQKGIQSFQTVIDEDRYTGSWGHRLGFAIVGIKIFQENPIIGRGTSDVRERTILFAEENPKYFINDRGRHFHNEHINFLVQVGLVGYLLFILFILFFLQNRLKDSFLSKIKIFYTLAILLLMLGEHYIMYIPTSAIFFAVFISLILLYQKQESHTLKIKENQ